MDYQNFRDIWMEIGCFIRSVRAVYGHPQVKIYSDYVDVVFKTDITIREWLEGGNERRIYIEDNSLMLVYTWSFNPDK